MGTHQNTVQRTVVFVLTVVSALLDGTLDALVGMAVHCCFLLLNDFGIIVCGSRKSSQGIFSILAFATVVWYGYFKREISNL